jgi:hypothetical protein
MGPGSAPAGRVLYEAHSSAQLALIEIAAKICPERLSRLVSDGCSRLVACLFSL